MLFDLFDLFDPIQQSKRRAHRICSDVRKLLATQQQQARHRQVEISALVVPTVDAVTDISLPGNEGLTTVQLPCIKLDDPLHKYGLQVKLMGNQTLSISIDKGDISPGVLT